jgi:uncharacterized damage-inducible protein DinB
LFTRDGIMKFHGWAHASIRLLLDHLSTVPEADYARALPGFGFPTLREQVIHLLNCEGFWIDTLQGRRYTDRSPTECPTVAEATVFEREISLQTHAYLSVLTDEQINSDTKLYFADGDVAVRTPALVVHHVLTHAFHHKGQAVAMCRVLGYPARDTDLIRFE